MKRLLVFVFAVTVIISCNFPNRDEALKQFKAAMQQASSNSNTANDDYNKSWIYTYQIDKMTSDTAYKADVMAKERLQFAFPYSEGGLANLFVSYSDSVNNMGLHITNGQFESDNSIVIVEIRFDNEKPLNIKTDMKVFEHERVLFFRNANELIEKLKKAKKVLVEAPFYEEGTRIMEFNVSKLVWNYKDAVKKEAVKNTKVSASSNSSSLDEVFQESYKRHLKEIKATVNASYSSYSTNNNSNDLPQVQTREIIDRDNGTVTLICKYHNTGDKEKNVTLNAKFYNNDGDVVATKSVSLTCSGNASITSQIVADGLGKDYKTYKLDVE
jgi:hypothetical protein